MIRVRKSVLFCKINCAKLFRSSSSCSTSLKHPRNFKPDHALSLSFSRNSAQSPVFPVLNAWRIKEPSNCKSFPFRKSSSSSLHGDSCCQMQSVSSCTVFVPSSNRCLAHPFLLVNRSHIFLERSIWPGSSTQPASSGPLSNLSRLRCSLSSLTVPTKIDRVRCATLFRYDGCKIIKTWSPFRRTSLSHMCFDPKTLSHCTWNEAHFFQALVVVCLQAPGKTRNPASPLILPVSLLSSFSARLQRRSNPWSTNVPLQLTSTPDTSERPTSTLELWDPDDAFRVSFPTASVSLGPSASFTFHSSVTRLPSFTASRIPFPSPKSRPPRPACVVRKYLGVPLELRFLASAFFLWFQAVGFSPSPCTRWLVASHCFVFASLAHPLPHVLRQPHQCLGSFPSLQTCCILLRPAHTPRGKMRLSALGSSKKCAPWIRSRFSKYLSTLAMTALSRAIYGGFVSSTSISFTSAGGSFGGPGHVSLNCRSVPSGGGGAPLRRPSG